MELSGLTSAPGTPWHRIWTKRRNQTVIPDPVIEDYYAGQLERANRAAGCERR